MNRTKIAWTQKTWNPTHGCSRVSDGCRSCYAETLSLRMKLTQKPWTYANAAENVQPKPHKLREPYKLKSPSFIFVNSMSDFFHEQIPDSYLEQAFHVMNDLPQHTFQILTKRPERAAKWPGPWSKNIWMGVSVEDERVIHRIETLRECRAHVKFISYEPALGPLGHPDLSGFNWLIVGGESGPHYRKMNMQWARQARDLARRYSLAFFFKQDAGPRSGMRPWLIEKDGTEVTIQEYPAPLPEDSPAILTEAQGVLFA